MLAERPIVPFAFACATSAGSATSRGTPLAGRSFASFAGLEAHLDAWTREVADQRTHGKVPHGLWALAAAMSFAVGCSALLLERVLPERIRRTPVLVPATD